MQKCVVIILVMQWKVKKEFKIFFSNRDIKKYHHRRHFMGQEEDITFVSLENIQDRFKAEQK
jgi:hypothetical protein